MKTGVTLITWKNIALLLMGMTVGFIALGWQQIGSGADELHRHGLVLVIGGCALLLVNYRLFRCVRQDIRAALDGQR